VFKILYRSTPVNVRQASQNHLGQTEDWFPARRMASFMYRTDYYSTAQYHNKEVKKGQCYPCNRPWRPIGLWDVEAPTYSRQSAHRWRWGCKPYAPAILYFQANSWYSSLLEAESTPGPYCGWKDWVNWKIQWPHSESNPRLSGL
jgi:hypothetical protein